MNTLIPWKRGDVQRSSTAPFSQMRSDWDRLFDRLLDDVWAPAAGAPSGGLPLDVIETDNELVLQLEVPGVDPQNLDVSLSGDVLTISGHKVEERIEERSRHHLAERRYGSFQRSLRLPVPVEAESVEAKSQNGLLTVTLRKAESLRPRKISVKS